MVILDKRNETVEHFWTSIGMKVTIMGVEEHDRIYALGKCSKSKNCQFLKLSVRKKFPICHSTFLMAKLKTWMATIQMPKGTMDYILV